MVNLYCVAIRLENCSARTSGMWTGGSAEVSSTPAASTRFDLVGGNYRFAHCLHVNPAHTLHHLTKAHLLLKHSSRNSLAAASSNGLSLVGFMLLRRTCKNSWCGRSRHILYPMLNGVLSRLRDDHGEAGLTAGARGEDSRLHIERK